MLKEHTFHPELDAIFDQAQENGVIVDFEGSQQVLLSQRHFDIMLAATASTAGDVKHVPVARADKPITYILQKETFDEIVEAHDDLVSMIRHERSVRCY